MLFVLNIRRYDEFLTADNEIFFNRDDLYIPSEEHQHEFIEIEYIIAGHGTQNVNGTTYNVQRGDIIIIELDSKHSYCSEKGLEVFNCIISPNYYNRIKEKILSSNNDFSFTTSPTHISLSSKSIIEIENLLFSMENELSQKQLFYKQMLEFYFSTFLLIIYRNVYAKSNKNVPKSQLFLLFEDYINQNLSDIKLTEIAARFGYSTSHFGRIFKSVMSKNLSDYVMEKRITEAIRLLSETSFSLDMICRQLGYKSRNQFHKIFKRKTGQTPKQFRQLHHQK